MRQITAMLKEYYDRLIVFGVLLALFASLLHLTVMKMDLDQRAESFHKEVKALTPRHPVMAPVTSQPFDSVLSQVKEPFHIPAWSNSMLGPEKRVRCMECLKPIGMEVDKCPFCQAIPPRGPVVIQPEDADKDDMNDEWERKYALNPRDPADADLDPDQDGFTSVDEFRGGTVPNDPNSHPDFIYKARVAKAYQVPFKLRFRSHMRGAEDTHIFQVNTVDNGKTYIVKLGQKVGEKGDDFLVEKYEFKEQWLTNNTQFGIGKSNLVDVSVLTVSRGEKRIPLILNRPVVWDEVRAVVVFPPDNTNWTVKVNDRITLRQANYVIMDIDSKVGSVVLRRPDSGMAFTVGAGGVVKVSEAIRSEPEAKASEAQEGERTP